MLLLTLRGTPTLYYGDELGMSDVPIPEDRLRDPVVWSLGPTHGRDPVRTPMQWDASPNAGFTTGEPWLPLADDFATRNVESQVGDDKSMLTLVRRLLALRRASAALQVGGYVPVTSDGDILAFVRGTADDGFLVALNLGGAEQRLTVPPGWRDGAIALSTELDREGEGVGTVLVLRPNEGIVGTATPSA
jgi:alpha-glucosidase